MTLSSSEAQAARRKAARAEGFKSIPGSTKGQRERFLMVLSDSANISRAARAAGITRTKAYRWRKAVASFRDAWEDALNEALDNYEEALRIRALNGVERPHFHGGAITGHYTTYSDTLALNILKARRPAKTVNAEPDTPQSDDTRDDTRQIDRQLDRIAAQALARAATLAAIEAHGQERD